MWRRPLTVCAILLCALVGFPAAAHGYDVSKSSNGVFLNRAVEDTVTVSSVILYYDYRGAGDGRPWFDAAADPWQTSAYRASKTLTISSTGWDGVELPLMEGHRTHLVYLTGVNKRYVVLREPLVVSQAATLPVTVSGVPTVTVSGVVSTGVSDYDPAFLAACGLGLLMLGVVAVKVSR